MKQNIKKQIKSTFLSKATINLLDDNKPEYSMMVLAMAIVENCFNGDYPFPSDAMVVRFKQHGVLPKAFFRQNFQRSSKLLRLIDENETDLDGLLELVIKSKEFETMELIDRKEMKTFYKLIKGD